MKVIRLIAIAIAVSFTLTACAQKRLFNNLPSGEGIEKVYINGALMKLSGVEQFSNVPKEAVKSLDSIEVIECTDSKTIKAVKGQLEALVKSEKMQMLMENDDGDDKDYIYVRFAPDGKMLDLIVIVSEECDEYDVVAISGQFDANGLAGMI